MEPQDRQQDDPLDAEADVLEAPESWEFFAAVRALAAQHPELPGVGRSTRVEQDAIRFRQKPSLRMEPSAIAAAERVATPDGQVIELTQTFFGPFGAHGALPQHVTDDAMADERLGASEAERQGARDLRDFTDIFTDRMTALLYRAWETTQIAVNRDRGEQDLYKHWISTLYGQGAREFADRDAMPDDQKRYLADWMSNPRGSVAGIESVLGALTGVRIEVCEYVPEWLSIPPEDQSRLGVGPRRLGSDIILGARSYSVQSRLRLRTETLSLTAFKGLLPGGTHHDAVRDAVRNLIGLNTAWELQVVLDAREVPRLSLDGTRRLGLDSWAAEKDRFTDAVDVTIDGTYRGAPTAGTMPQTI